MEEEAIDSTEFTLFVTADGSVSEAVRTALAEWVRAGMVAESYFTSPAACETEFRVYQECAPSFVDLSSGETDGLTTLADTLSPKKWSRVRLVAVHLALSADVDVAVADLAMRLRTYLEGALPTREFCDLVTINLVVPATGVKNLPRSILLEGWYANVLAAPEDRYSGMYPNGGVHAENFAHHAALHCAVVAGLFRAQNGGPFDAGEESGPVRLDLAVERCFARVLFVEPFFADLDDAAFEAHGSWPMPVSVGLVPAIDAFRVVRQAADAAPELEHGLLRYRPYQPLSTKRQRTIKLLEALKLFFGSILNRIRRLPSDLVTRLRYDVEQRATAIVRGISGLGDDSALLPTVGGRDAPAPLAEPLVLARDAAAAMAMLEKRNLKLEIPSPTLWDALRAESFALIDGSAISDPFPKLQSAGHREVVGDPHAIAPDPATGSLSFSTATAMPLRDLHVDTTVIRPGDAATAALLRVALETEKVRLENPPEEDGAAAANGDAESNTVGTDEPESDAREQSSTTDENTEARTPTLDPASQRRLSAVDDALAELSVWEENRSHSFMWLVASYVAKQTEAAQSAFVAAYGRIKSFADEDNPAPSEEVTKAKGSLRRKLILLTLGFVGAILLAIFVPPIFFESVLIGIALVILVFGGFILGAGLSYLRYCRQMFALEHRLRGLETDFDNAVETAAQALNEINRLATIYDTMLDWIEIIGWCVHHPWGSAEAARGTLESSVDNLKGPRALVLAEGRPDEGMLQRLSTSFAHDELHKLGWLSQMYTERADAIIRETAEDDVLDVNELVADRETVKYARARSALLHGFADHEAGMKYRRVLTRRLEKFCRQQGPLQLVEKVRIANAPITPRDPTLPVFLSGALESDGYLGKQDVVRGMAATKADRCACWLPAGSGIEDKGTNAPQHWYSVRVAADEPYIVSTISFECVDDIEPGQLEIFGDDEPSTARDSDEVKTPPRQTNIVG